MSSRLADHSNSEPRGPERITAPGERYWPELDGLRTVAVTLVILAHVGIPWARGGAIGVDIFFTLSGFLITTVLLDEFKRTNEIRLARFYARRLLRLYPALLCLVLLGVSFASLLDPEAKRQTNSEAVQAISYTMNWFSVRSGGTGAGIFSHCWSLAVEEQFYLVWPLALLLMLDRLRPGIAIAVTAVLVVFSIALEVALYRHFGWRRVYYGTDARFPQLLIGAIAAMAYSNRRPSARIALGINAIAAMGALLILGSAALSPPRYLYAQLGYWCVALGTAAIILTLVNNPATSLRRSIGSAIAVAIGRVSYGVYLWHWPIAYSLSSLAPNLGPYARLGIVAPTSIGIALVSFRFVERPFLRLKKRLA